MKNYRENREEAERRVAREAIEEALYEKNTKMNNGVQYVGNSATFSIDPKTRTTQSASFGEEVSPSEIEAEKKRTEEKAKCLEVARRLSRITKREKWLRKLTGSSKY